MSRAKDVLAVFNETWAHPDYPPTAVEAAELERAEAMFAYAYPAAYRDAVLAIGLPGPTADLWDAIEETESDLPHLSEFLTPQEAIETARDWRAMGFPEALVPFASDSGGNLLAFSSQEKDGAVWLWDHDGQTTEQIAVSFEVLIDTYCRLPRAGA